MKCFIKGPLTTKGLLVKLHKHKQSGDIRICIATLSLTRLTFFYKNVESENGPKFKNLLSTHIRLIPIKMFVMNLNW